MSVSSKRSRPRAELRRRTRRVADALGAFLGIPRPPARRAAPLSMLIATILSQNTNDRNSHRAYRELRKRYPSWESAARARPAALRAAIRSGGMAAQKAATIGRTLARVRERFGAYDLSPLARMTDDGVIAELTGLKGVGIKTAACVLLFSLGRDVFPVDTHVHRICTRLGLVPRGGSPARTFERMRDLVPRSRAYAFHTNLIRFGRTVCRAQLPACGSCPLYSLCRHPAKRAHRNRMLRPSRTDHRFMVLDHVGRG